MSKKTSENYLELCNDIADINFKPMRNRLLIVSSILLSIYLIGVALLFKCIYHYNTQQIIKVELFCLIITIVSGISGFVSSIAMNIIVICWDDCTTMEIVKLIFENIGKGFSRLIN